MDRDYMVNVPKTSILSIFRRFHSANFIVTLGLVLKQMILSWVAPFRLLEIADFNSVFNSSELIVFIVTPFDVKSAKIGQSKQ